MNTSRRRDPPGSVSGIPQARGAWATAPAPASSAAGEQQQQQRAAASSTPTPRGSALAGARRQGPAQGSGIPGLTPRGPGLAPSRGAPAAPASASRGAPSAADALKWCAALAAWWRR
jgi:hypothetical protein